MLKLKKIAVFVLTAMICAMPISVTSTAFTTSTAAAATSCNHSIYRASSVKVGSYSYTETTYVKMEAWSNLYQKKSRTVTVTTYQDVYCCSKCNYTYRGGSYTKTTYSAWKIDGLVTR